MSGTKGRGAPSGPLRLEKTSVAVVFGSPGAAAVTRVTATLTGLRTTDLVEVNPPTGVIANIGFVGARVSAANVIEVWVVNPTAAPIVLGTVTLGVVINRFTG